MQRKSRSLFANYGSFFSNEGQIKQLQLCAILWMTHILCDLKMLNAVKPVFFFFRNGHVYADYSLFYCTTQNTSKAVVSQLQVTVLTNIP